MEWKDKDEDGTASVLEITNEFRTFVKPTWRPQLSDFCKELTGISQVSLPFIIYIDVVSALKVIYRSKLTLHQISQRF